MDLLSGSMQYALIGNSSSPGGPQRATHRSPKKDFVPGWGGHPHPYQGQQMVGASSWHPGIQQRGSTSTVTQASPGTATVLKRPADLVKLHGSFKEPYLPAVLVKLHGFFKEPYLPPVARWLASPEDGQRHSPHLRPCRYIHSYGISLGLPSEWGSRNSFERKVGRRPRRTYQVSLC